MTVLCCVLEEVLSPGFSDETNVQRGMKKSQIIWAQVNDLT